MKSSIRTKLEYAKNLTKTGKYYQAEILCKSILKDPDLPEHSQGLIYQQLGFIAFSANKEKKARKELIRAIESGHIDSNILYAIGQLFLIDDNLEEAKRYFEWSIKEESQNEDSIFGLSQIEINQGSFKEALPHLTWLIDNKSNLQDALLKRAKVYDYLGEYSKAEKDVDSILDINPNSYDILIFKISIQLCQGKLKQAATNFYNTPKQYIMPHFHSLLTEKAKTIAWQVIENPFRSANIDSILSEIISTFRKSRYLLIYESDFKKINNNFSFIISFLKSHQSRIHFELTELKKKQIIAESGRPYPHNKNTELNEWKKKRLERLKNQKRLSPLRSKEDTSFDTLIDNITQNIDTHNKIITEYINMTFNAQINQAIAGIRKHHINNFITKLRLLGCRFFLFISSVLFILFGLLFTVDPLFSTFKLGFFDQLFRTNIPAIQKIILGLVSFFISILLYTQKDKAIIKKLTDSINLNYLNIITGKYREIIFKHVQCEALKYFSFVPHSGLEAQQLCLFLKDKHRLIDQKLSAAQLLLERPRITDDGILNEISKIINREDITEELKLLLASILAKAGEKSSVELISKILNTSFAKKSNHLKTSSTDLDAITYLGYVDSQNAQNLLYEFGIRYLKIDDIAEAVAIALRINGGHNAIKILGKLSSKYIDFKSGLNPFLEQLSYLDTETAYYQYKQILHNEKEDESRYLIVLFHLLYSRHPEAKTEAINRLKSVKKKSFTRYLFEEFNIGEIYQQEAVLTTILSSDEISYRLKWLAAERLTNFKFKKAGFFLKRLWDESQLVDEFWDESTFNICEIYLRSDLEESYLEIKKLLISPKESNLSKKTKAIQGLLKIGNDRSINILIEIATSPINKTDVRSLANAALIAFGDSHGDIEFLLYFLKDSNFSIGDKASVLGLCSEPRFDSKATQKALKMIIADHNIESKLIEIAKICLA